MEDSKPSVRNEIQYFSCYGHGRDAVAPILKTAVGPSLVVEARTRQGHFSRCSHTLLHGPEVPREWVEACPCDLNVGLSLPAGSVASVHDLECAIFVLLPVSSFLPQVLDKMVGANEC